MSQTSRLDATDPAVTPLPHLRPIRRRPGFSAAWLLRLVGVVIAFDPAAAATTGRFGEADAKLNLPSVQGDRPPRVVSRVAPYYPTEYAQNGVEGEVLVEFIVLADGTVKNAHAVEATDPRLEQLAVQAVSQWHFSPGVKQGRAVNTLMRQPISFQPGMQTGTPPAELDPKVAALSRHQSQGQTALAQQAYDMAHSEFTAAIQLAPDAAESYVGRAQALAGLAREDEALADYAQAAGLDPRHGAALETYRKSLPDSPERRWASLRYETFNLVWRTVYETYFDATFGGVDWLATREKYRRLLEGVPDHQKLRELLQTMLAELRRSHFSILPREMAVFNPSERVRIGTTGAEVAVVEGGVTVTEVRADSPAAAADLHPGDEILSVDGHDLQEGLARLAQAGLSETRSRLYLTQFVDSQLSGAVGTKVNLTVRAPGNDTTPREVTLTCAANDAEWSEPMGYFPSIPIRCEAKRGPDGIAVLRFNAFVPPAMKPIRALLRELGPEDGLIVDLRGNGGGISVMASGLCGWLCRAEFVLGAMHQREGVVELSVYPQRRIFDGPIAVLVDGRSASTSEILAAGLKERKRARIFGETSAGAALPSIFKSLPTGDLFQFAVADVTTPSGALLEGHGVVPDTTVPNRRSELAAGHDAVLTAAREWIDAERTRRRAEVSSQPVRR